MVKGSKNSKFDPWRILDGYGDFPVSERHYRDTLYILAFTKQNDISVHYGSNGSSLAHGSKNQTENYTTTNFYNNVNDVLGFGLTYKIIDFDLYYSLPTTQLQEEGLQNLEQFRLSGTYYSRRLAIGGWGWKVRGSSSPTCRRIPVQP